MVRMDEQVPNWKELGVLHCTRCNLKTSDAGLFQAHNCRPVVQQRNRASLTYKSQNESFLCSLCNIDVPEKAIEEHLENHVSLKPYKCKHCQVAFHLQAKFLHYCKEPNTEFQLIISDRTKDLILRARQNHGQKELYMPLNVTVKAHLLTNSNSRPPASSTPPQNAPPNLHISKTLQEVRSISVLSTNPQFSKVQYLMAPPIETAPLSISSSCSFVPVTSPLETYNNNNVHSYPSHVVSPALGHLSMHSTVNNHPSPALTNSSEIFSWHRPAGCADAQEQIPQNQAESVHPDSAPLTSCVTKKAQLQQDSHHELQKEQANTTTIDNNKRNENQSEQMERWATSFSSSLNENISEDYSYLCVIKGYYLCLQCKNKWWECNAFFMHIWQHHIHTSDLLTCCPQGFSLNCERLITALRSVYGNLQEHVPEILKKHFQTFSETKNKSETVENSGQIKSDDVAEDSGQNNNDDVDENSGQNNNDDVAENSGQNNNDDVAENSGQNNNDDVAENSGQNKNSAIVVNSGLPPTTISTNINQSVSTRATRTSMDRTSRCSTDSMEYLDSDTKSSEIKSYYQCGFQNCNYASMRPVDFLHHIEEAHGSETSFSCNYCGYVGTSSSSLLDHLGEHIGTEDALVFSGSIISENGEYCHQSKDIHSIIGKFEEQLKNQEPTQFTILCKTCQTKFFSLLEFREHLINSLLKVISCKNCRSYFLDAGSWQKHRAKEHPNEPRLYCINRKLLCNALKLYNQGVPLYKQNVKRKNSFDEQTIHPTTAVQTHSTTAIKQTNSTTDVERTSSPTALERTGSPTAIIQTNSTTIERMSTPIGIEMMSFPAAIVEEFESQGNKQLDLAGNIAINYSNNIDSTTKKEDLVTSFLSHPSISQTLPLESNCNEPKCSTPDIEKSCQMQKLKDICGEHQTDEFLKSFYESTKDNTFSCKKCKRKAFSLKRMHAHLFNCIGKLGVSYCPYCSYEGEHSKFLVKHIEKEHPDKEKNLVIYLNVNTLEFMQALQSSCVNFKSFADICAEFKSIKAYEKIKQLRSTENLSDLLSMSIVSENSESVVDSTTCENATPFSDAREKKQTPLTSENNKHVNEKSTILKKDELTQRSAKEDIQSEKQSKIKLPTKRKYNFTEDFVYENKLRSGLSEISMSVDSTTSENVCEMDASPLSNVRENKQIPKASEKNSKAMNGLKDKSTISNPNGSKEKSTISSSDKSTNSSTKETMSTQKKMPTKRKLNSSENKHRPGSSSKISLSSDNHSSNSKLTVPDVINNIHTKEHVIKRTGLKAGIKHVPFQRYRCNLQCDYICKWNESSMVEHLRTSHPYQACGHCGAVYFTKFELEYHSKFAHIGKKACKSDAISVKDFFTLVSMKPNCRKNKDKHLEGDKIDNLENKNDKSLDERVYKTADKNSLQSNSAVAFSTHHDNQTSGKPTTPDATVKKASRSIFPFKCSVCSSYRKYIADIVDHFRWLHAKQVVEFIDRKCRIRYTLKENTLTCKPGSTVPSAKHFCYFCSYRHHKRSEVEAHIAADHSGCQIKVLSLESPEQVHTEKDDTSDTGTDIEDGFKTRSNTRVAAKPNPVTNYNCPKCDDLSSSLFAFRLHLAMKHEGFRPITALTSTAIAGLLLCHVCGYIANSHGDLGTHMAWHIQERQFICSHCNFDSHTRKGVLGHIKIDHLDDPNVKIINRSLQANLLKPVLVDLDPVVAIPNCLSSENADYLRKLLVKHEIKLLDVEGEDICENILQNQNKNEQYFDVRTINNY